MFYIVKNLESISSKESFVVSIDYLSESVIFINIFVFAYINIYIHTFT